jgi:protein-disulfide isomerase
MKNKKQQQNKTIQEYYQGLKKQARTISDYTERKVAVAKGWFLRGRLTSETPPTTACSKRGSVKTLLAIWSDAVRVSPELDALKTLDEKSYEFVARLRRKVASRMSRLFLPQHPIAHKLQPRGYHLYISTAFVIMLVTTGGISLPNKVAFAQAPTWTRNCQGELAQSVTTTQVVSAESSTSATQATTPSATALTPDQVSLIDISTAPSWGPADAKATIIVWTDFQCPYCKRYHEQTLTPLKTELGDSLRIVYQMYPLSFHDQANLAARAYLAASKQDKAYEMADLLFANQGQIDEAKVAELANQLKINVDQFNQDINDQSIADQVQAQLKVGTDIGISGTPGTVIADQRYSGAIQLESLESLISN